MKKQIIKLNSKEVERFFEYVLSGEENRFYEVFISSLLEYTKDGDLPHYTHHICNISLGLYWYKEWGDIELNGSLVEKGCGKVCEEITLSKNYDKTFNAKTLQKWIESELNDYYNVSLDYENFIKTNNNLKMN